VLGSGAILVSLILAAIAALVIDRKMVQAAGFAVAGSVLTFFGFMHSEAIGIGKTPTVALSYLVVGAVLYGLSRAAAKVPTAAMAESSHGTPIGSAPA